MKHSVLALLIAVGLSFSLVACGASSYEKVAPATASYTDPGAASQASMVGDCNRIAAPTEAGNETPNSGVKANQRKVVRHMNRTLETKNFDETLLALNRIIGEAGGYMESQEVTGVSMTAKGLYNERYATLHARIPADKLDGVTAGVDGICNVLSRSESAEDITDGYYDAQAHLDSLRIQEERLLAILEKAEKLEDVVALERALAEVRYEIESLTSSLLRMDQQVSYTYLNIELREVVEYREITDLPKGFGARLSAAWGRSIEKLADTLEGMLIFIVEDAPTLLVWLAVLGLVAWALVRLARRVIRVANAKRNHTTTPPSKPPEA